MSLYQELGKQLFDALNSGQSIGPLRALIDNDVDAAYAVQKELVTLRKARGEKVVGKKIGLTSFAVQNQLGVDQQTLEFDHNHYPYYWILMHKILQVVLSLQYTCML